jgi:small nuclear ribonucleoprotein (snRNP)-like protein
MVFMTQTKSQSKQPEKQPEKKDFAKENLLRNKYLEELNKMLQQEVEVKDIDGTVYKGVLRGFYMQHLNICIMTDTEKVIIRNWVSMKRKRNKTEEKGG